MTASEIAKARQDRFAVLNRAYPLPTSPERVQPDHVVLLIADALWEIALQLAKANESDRANHLHIVTPAAAVDEFS